MKNLKSILSLALVTLICICMLSSCGEEVKYEAHTRFLYSVDGGNTFKETLQEVPVNSTYYLAVEMLLSSVLVVPFTVTPGWSSR